MRSATGPSLVIVLSVGLQTSAHAVPRALRATADLLDRDGGPTRARACGVQAVEGWLADLSSGGAARRVRESRAMLASTDRRLLSFRLDLPSCVKFGQDPRAMARRGSGRIASLRLRSGTGIEGRHLRSV